MPNTDKTDKKQLFIKKLSVPLNDTVNMHFIFKFRHIFLES